MEDFFDAMNKRKNVNTFSQDSYPEKAEIESILQETIEIAPIKNNIYNFCIEVYGPEHLKEKDKVVLNTVRNLDKKDLPIDLLRKHYINKTALFNEQVKAPYLLLYKKSLNHFNKNDFKDDHIETGAMGAMVHGYIVSVLANIRDISASFCSCFSSKDSHNYIINNRKDFYFLLGLGYAEQVEKNYSRWKKEDYLPKLNEVIKWK